MKNFKKVLALVLAVATVLSFAVMTNAADAFTDSAAITHTEAVDVLTGIGVINGFEDKSFKPAEGVTRVQMAKMIGLILNDGDDINDLYKDACTFADSKSNWGAGWIAYCASEGIIAGRDANTFDPNANVTGTEAAKMLLCALGYNANYEGFVGADWAANTMKKAKDVSLLKELSQGKMNVALNREDAAQMIFNALKAEAIEEYSGNNTKIKVNGAEIDMDPGRALPYGAASTIFGVASGKSTTLADLHFRDNVPTGGKRLYYVAGANSDAFGAVADAWRYGKSNSADNDIGNGITLAKTFQNSITAADIYALTGKIDTAANDELYIALNGNVVADTANIAGTGIIAAPVGFTDTDINGAKTKTTWKADEIAIYVDDLANGGRRVQVIGKNYYFGQIVEHTDAVGATKEKVEIAFAGAAYNVPAANTFVFGAGQDEYETEAFSEADIKAETKVLFTFANGSIQSMEKIEAVKSGEVTKATTKDGNTVITADGKEYTFRNNFNAAVANTITAKNEYELYISPNGRVQAAKLIEAGASNFYMVMATNKSQANTLDDKDITYSVRLLGTDGKTVDLKVASVNGIAVGKQDATASDNTIFDARETNTGSDAATVYGWNDGTNDLIVGATKAIENMQIRTAAPGTIVTYTLNSKGEAKLLTTGFTATSYTTVANGTGSYKAAAATTNFNYDDLTNIATDLTGTAANKATAKTTFVLISLDANDNYVYTPVTGLAAMKAAVGNYEYKQRTVAVKAGDAFASAAFIFVDKRNETSAKTVFAPFGTLTSQTETIGDNSYTFYEVQAVEGTEKKTLKVDAALFVAGNATGDNKLTMNNFTVAKSYKTNDDGIVTDITEDYSYVVGTAQQTYTAGAIAYEDGVLTVGTREFVNDNINVYLYSVEDEAFITRRASTLRDEDFSTDYAVYVALTTAKVTGNSTNSVSAIFAVKNDNAEPTPMLDETAKTLTIGKTAKLAVRNAVGKTLSWSSDNASVATVDENGVVTAVAPGVANIVVSWGGSGNDFCTVTVESGYLPINPDVPVDPDAPQFVVQSRNGCLGGKFYVDVSLKNNPGISSLNLLVSFSEDLTLTDIQFNKEIGGQYMLPQTMDDPVLVWVRGQTNLEEDAVIATLMFQSADDAANEQIITVTYNPEDVHNIDEVNLDFAVQSGTIHLKQYLPGDITGDGYINNKDITRMMKWFAGWKSVSYVEDALDTNGDGNVDSKDLNRLFQYVAQWDVELF